MPIDPLRSPGTSFEHAVTNDTTSETDVTTPGTSPRQPVSSGDRLNVLANLASDSRNSLIPPPANSLIAAIPTDPDAFAHRGAFRKALHEALVQPGLIDSPRRLMALARRLGVDAHITPGSLDASANDLCRRLDMLFSDPQEGLAILLRHLNDMAPALGPPQNTQPFSIDLSGLPGPLPPGASSLDKNRHAFAMADCLVAPGQIDSKNRLIALAKRLQLSGHVNTQGSLQEAMHGLVEAAARRELGDGSLAAGLPSVVQALRSGPLEVPQSYSASATQSVDASNLPRLDDATDSPSYRRGLYAALTKPGMIDSLEKARELATRLSIPPESVAGSSAASFVFELLESVERRSAPSAQELDAALRAALQQPFTTAVPEPDALQNVRTDHIPLRPSPEEDGWRWADAGGDDGRTSTYERALLNALLEPGCIETLDQARLLADGLELGSEVAEDNTDVGCYLSELLSARSRHFNDGAALGVVVVAALRGS